MEQYFIELSKVLLLATPTHLALLLIDFIAQGGDPTGTGEGK